MEKNTLIIVGQLRQHAESWAKKHVLPASQRPSFTSISDVYDFCRGTVGMTILFVNVFPGQEFVMYHAHRNNIVTIQDNS